jgi:hypothetical protein
VVTAHYSDGTSAPVSGYTLSGTIAKGSNTITVSYGGMTTTFTVTGLAESGGDTFDSGLIDLTTQTIGDNANTTHEVVNKHTLIVNPPDTPTNDDYSYILANGLTPGRTYDLYIEPYDLTSKVSIYSNKIADATYDAYDVKIRQATTITADNNLFAPFTFTLPANNYGIIIYCYYSVTKLRLVEVG